MGRNLGPSCRQCRREGEKLFLKGTRCTSHKCAIDRRQYAPGQHGAKRTKLSNYGLQLREKQKLKRIYGLLERQFRLYFAKAARKKGVTGTMLLQNLETRLDNVVFQMGFAASRNEARQIVGHGFVLVNDKPVNIPSFSVKENDEISFQPQKKSLEFIKENIKATAERNSPAWLEVDRDHLKGKVKRLPQREDIQYPVNEQLVVELYSR
ncbi:MAG: 30S ribosomal protein S4 [Omnitrophica WOR_2 bacterium RIFCSPHIGHO2_01_FULL_48_9]|nr:MAG: 30S ribosomal protein S4 [Omnitrophica WOR_2 bacterium RIFCSPHIGHO2_02_FULL_48_11]OGX33333.1 MAG: 30S ribosomal protein S4 [Omnitrophica WOR_2 bacterium RIFCSPHIGHO2_01_FULL_48_9]